jgi:3-oxoacyl-[acyl-carrier-protein] synthase-1
MGHSLKSLNLPHQQNDMRRVYFGADNIITSLGFTIEENAGRILAGESGIRNFSDFSLYPSFIAASRVRDDISSKLFSASPNAFTRLEKILIRSISEVLVNKLVDPEDQKTVFILSTTKGNVDLLEGRNSKRFDADRVNLWKLGDVISQYFGNPNKPVIVSNACISGSVAIMVAARMIAAGKYDHAVVTGGDIVSEFVVSGFMSFQALSPHACKPFDANRTGLSLGEGAGSVILTADITKTGYDRPVAFLGGATSNDANHISGPSRDGEGLYLAIEAALREANMRPEDIDFISAHGTATPYNDEMESLALAWAGLDKVPVNSFKGYIGHTLGAAGLIETILSLYSIRNNILIKSLGYVENGVSRPLNIITENTNAPIRNVLKTASGFGGCNAALVIGN